MDKKMIEEFKGKSAVVLKGIEDLQNEIKKYKDGAESFRMATEMLEEVTRRQEDLVKNIEDYVAGLYKMDTEEMIERLTEVGGTIKKAESEIDESLTELIRTRKYLEKIGEMEERIKVLEKRDFK